MASAPKISKTGNQEFIDPVFLKPQKMHIVEKENTEHISQLYTKLFQEAEKIKRWKLSIENELWQKDKKLQENKHTIEVQRKAIQEQQFENESLSMKLEEEISKNEEATKIHNATRDLCSLVNESSSRLAEKIKAYESERDETRRLYAENSENIERIIMAFEELRIQAENTRSEIIFKLKEEIEQREQLTNKYQHQLNDKENEVLQFQQQYKQKDTELHETWISLQESKIKCDQLEEATRHLNENLLELHAKEQNLTTELEKTKDLLNKMETSQKYVKEELESAKEVIIQITKEKESKIEEFEKAKSNSVSAIDELKNTVKNLEESFRTEQQRLEQVQETLQISSLELEKRIAILGELEQLKIENELKINQLTEALENKSKSKEKLEEELANEKLESRKYFEELEMEKKTRNDLQDSVVILVHKTEDLQKSVDELMKENENLKEIAENNENMHSELQRQIANALGKEKDCFEQMNILKTEHEEERRRYDKLYSDYNILLAEKEALLQDLNNESRKIKDLQKKLEKFEYKEELAKKEIEALKEQNYQQSCQQVSQILSDHYDRNVVSAYQRDDIGDPDGPTAFGPSMNDLALQNAVSLKLPTFWTTQPLVWFEQAEAQFQVRQIASDATKYYYMVGTLDQETADRVIDFLRQPPATDRYKALKALLIRTFGLSRHERAVWLLHMDDLGGRAPSALMSDMLALAEGHKPYQLFEQIFLEQMPEDIRLLLADEDFRDPRGVAARTDVLWHAKRIGGTTIGISAATQLKAQPSHTPAAEHRTPHQGMAPLLSLGVFIIKGGVPGPRPAAADSHVHFRENARTSCR
ncbi:synaptonemal complex protein 1 [Mobula hypostoma]|uniref:synaptonemal complex protein 1 n=1 Tax=Mobula hypostoma TaxID=723540 RepID=UPI002FC2CD67